MPSIILVRKVAIMAQHLVADQLKKDKKIYENPQLNMLFAGEISPTNIIFNHLNAKAVFYEQPRTSFPCEPELGI